MSSSAIVKPMKTTLGRVRRVVREASKISASPAYMKKERVRERLQQLIADQVAAGEITDQDTLEGVLKDVDMAMGVLKSIPFEVWQKLSRLTPKQ